MSANGGNRYGRLLGVRNGLSTTAPRKPASGFGLPTLNQMLPSGRWLERFGPEVDDLGDQAVGRLEEGDRELGLAAVEDPAEQHAAVHLVAEDHLRLQVPVAGILLIEGDIAVAPPD